MSIKYPTQYYYGEGVEGSFVECQMYIRGKSNKDHNGYDFSTTLRLKSIYCAAFSVNYFCV